MRSSPPGRGSILIVEDDSDQRESLIDLLHAEGYPAAGVPNGREALDELRQSPPPCLILLDLMMPVMNGWEFRDQQRRDPALAAIPVAVVTGVRSSEEQLDSLGAVDYFQKPIDLTALLATVSEYC